MPSLHAQSYVFDPREYLFPLQTVVKRYWNPDSTAESDTQALTLILAHALGAHKEQWEPLLEDLFEMVEKQSRCKIGEAWCLDGPNHGDAAVLNEEVLSWGYEPVFHCEEYGRVIQMFLDSLGSGIDVDFKQRRLVGIGHSMGATSLLLSLTYQPKFHFESLILIEPITAAQRYANHRSETLIKITSTRRDTWDSKEDAFTLLSQKGLKSWDKRVLRTYVEHGLRPLPTPTYPDIKSGVTLKCTKKQEMATAGDLLGTSRAYRSLQTIAKRVPIHLIYGAVNDFFPQEVKDDVVQVAAGGVENLASLSTVPRAGHLAIQMNPTGVAEKVYNALIAIESRRQRPRL